MPPKGSKRAPPDDQAAVLPEAKTKPGKKAKAQPAPAKAQDASLMVSLGASSCPGASTQAISLNGAMWSQHLDNVRVFKEQSVSEDATQLWPDRNSFGQAYDEKMALESLKREGKYLCLMNALWLDQSWSATPQIPISQGAIDQVKAHWFSKPNGLDQQQVTVGVLQQEVDSKKMPAFGTWKRLSAEESIIAFFDAAGAEAKNVQAGAVDGELQKWLAHCLSCPVLIRVVAILKRWSGLPSS